MGQDVSTAAIAHGIDNATYVSFHFGKFHLRPCLICKCGRRYPAETWKEAGADFDDHLSKNTRG